MIIGPDEKLTRIGVFYDGGYFDFVRKFYKFHHELRRQLSIRGLHDFIKKKVAVSEPVEERFCRIVDAHYFRGRFSAEETERHSPRQLFRDRVFDDVLMRAGVITHNLQMQRRPGNQWKEMGIDVWFSLEAFELAIYKRFNVLVLLTGDGDYLPLIRKLNTLGTRVMLLQWDFVYDEEVQDRETGERKFKHRETRVHQALIDEATYTVDMYQEIESLLRDRTRDASAEIDKLFLPKPKMERDAEESPSIAPSRPHPVSPRAMWPTQTKGVEYSGRILSFTASGIGGYIEKLGGGTVGWFFHANNVVSPGGIDSLAQGDTVNYTLDDNPEREGRLWAVKVKKVAVPPQPTAPPQDAGLFAHVDGQSAAGALEAVPSDTARAGDEGTKVAPIG